MRNEKKLLSWMRCNFLFFFFVFNADIMHIQSGMNLNIFTCNIYSQRNKSTYRGDDF